MPSNQKKFTDQQFLEHYKKGLNDTEIATIFNSDRTAVTQRRNKLNLLRQPQKGNPNPPPNKRFTDQQLIKLYNKKPPLTTRQMAKILNVNHTTIIERLTKLKLPTKIPCTHTDIPRPIIIYKCENIKPNRKFTDKQFIALYNQGLSDRTIAKLLNVGHEATWLRRIKLKLPPNKPKYFSNVERSYKIMREGNKRTYEEYKRKHPQKFKRIKKKIQKRFQQKHPLYQRKYYPTLHSKT